MRPAHSGSLLFAAAPVDRGEEAHQKASEGKKPWGGVRLMLDRPRGPRPQCPRQVRSPWLPQLDSLQNGFVIQPQLRDSDLGPRVQRSAAVTNLGLSTLWIRSQGHWFGTTGAPQAKNVFGMAENTAFSSGRPFPIPRRNQTPHEDCSQFHDQSLR